MGRVIVAVWLAFACRSSPACASEDACQGAPRGVPCTGPAMYWEDPMDIEDPSPSLVQISLHKHHYPSVYHKAKEIRDGKGGDEVVQGEGLAGKECCQQKGFAPLLMNKCRKPKDVVGQSCCDTRFPQSKKDCIVVDKPADFETKKKTYCGGWKNLKDHKSELESELVKWGKFRTQLVKHALFKARKQYTIAETTIAGSDKIDSDIDVSVQGKNPGLIIKYALSVIAGMLKELCGDDLGDKHDADLVEHYIDTNLYGDLVVIDEFNVFNQLVKRGDWPEEMKSLLQKGKTKKGKSIYALSTVCNEELMLPRVYQRIEAARRKVLHAVKKPPCPSAEVNNERLLEQLHTFYSALSNKDEWTSGQWTADRMLEELMDVAELQTEAYLTSAAVYDVVILTQIKATGLGLDGEQTKCVQKISTLEQHAFVVQHIHEDIMKKPDGSLNSFLVGASKYFMRMHESVLPDECKNIVEAGAEVKNNRDDIKTNLEENGEDARVTALRNALLHCIGLSDTDFTDPQSLARELLFRMESQILANLPKEPRQAFVGPDWCATSSVERVSDPSYDPNRS